MTNVCTDRMCKAATLHESIQVSEHQNLLGKTVGYWVLPKGKDHHLHI